MQQALTFAILQLKKLRHGEAMYFAQSHGRNMWGEGL